MLHTLLRCCLCSFFVLQTAGFLFGPNAFAQSTKPIPLQPLTPARAKAEWAMQQPYSANYVDTPLPEVLEEIRRKFGVNVYVDDRQRLLEQGIDANTLTVTCHLQNVTLESYLQGALQQHDLVAFCHSEAIYINASQSTEEILEVVVYPVADLLRWHRSRNSPNQRVPDADGLVECITSTIAPDSWDEVGGPGSIAFDDNSLSLVVSQHPKVQKQVAQLFKALRQSQWAQKMPHRMPAIEPAELPSAAPSLRGSASVSLSRITNSSSKLRSTAP